MDSPHPGRPAGAPAMGAPLVDAVFRGAPCGIVVVSADGAECLAVNETMERLGLIVPGATGQAVGVTALPGVVAAIEDALEECRITRAPHSAEMVFNVGGRESWWLVSSSPVHDAHGDLRRIVCSFFYVDFLKRTEEELRRSERTFRTLIEKMPDAVIVTDRRGVRYVNAAALGLLGVARAADLIGSPAAALIDGDDIGAIRRASLSVVRGDVRSLVEARVVRKDGRRVMVEFVPIPVDFEGAPCLLVVARDITERNELHARLAHADRTIAIGTLAAGVSHEINTPLAAVMANISFVMDRLEEQGLLTDELREPLAEGLEGVDRVAKIVRGLRGLARGEAGSVRAVDLRRSVELVERLARPEVERVGRLVVEAVDLAPVRASTIIDHVFLNLLLNAAQAIPPGAPAANEVRLVMAERDDGAVVEVSDTGNGIAPHHLPRIFDPFFTTKPVGQGTGLGLALAMRIVEASGGRLTARSAGRGATFEVWLPFAGSDTPPPMNVP